MTDKGPPDRNSATEQVEIVLPAPKASPGRRVVNWFLAGLVLTGPIAITLYLAWTVIGWIDAAIVPLIPERLNPANYLPFPIPGLGLIVSLVVITAIGFFAANFIGRSLFHYGERIVGRLPVISSIYNALKQIFDTLITQRGTSFKQVGLMEYPRKGVWAIVLIASEARGELGHKIPGEDLIGVFMPTTPNPTTGFLMFLPREDVIILDMSVEEGAKLIISAGLVAPPYVPGQSGPGAPTPKLTTPPNSSL
ncbi:DUF502 domain-containing protein [Pelagibacterium luteolum]|uniref:Uncharacterized membrane protein n=1 Tax=Pelagibacterium luteolum TaxID=440168 RepID=A0A1G7VWV1_9HYPH|nr:DUF502 domain-containing protein [Pelagibacterium luteolum]SDG64284.1 Uncharacterized membrane protein [Pelagibacterium luteolum]